MSVTYETSFTIRGATGIIHQRHQILCLPRKMTRIINPRDTCNVIYNARNNRHRPSNSPDVVPRKITRIINPRNICNVIYNARNNRYHPPTSPNTAPATQNDSHDWCPSHITHHLQCAEQQISSSNITKYCACHAKWISWLIFVTCETSFSMRGATGITLQPHQILRLPRKIALQNLSKILRERLKRHFQCAADSSVIRT